MFNKKWLKDTLERIIRTMAQTLVAVIGTNALLSEIDWTVALSTTLLSGLICFLMAVATPPKESGVINEKDT